MEAKEQFAEAVRRILRLIVASTSPARREVAALSSEAPAAKERRLQASVALSSAEAREARLGRIPVLGTVLRRSVDRGRQAVQEADLAWTSVLSRARLASDLLASASRAHAAATAAAIRVKAGGAMPSVVAERVNGLLLRARFLAETDGRDFAGATRLGPKAFLLAAEARELAKAWDGAPIPAAQNASVEPAEPVAHNVSAKSMGGKRVQLALDFDGTGQTEEEPRIWLPVSTTRAREMVERGARLDRTRGRGSRLWIPVSERDKLDAFLPLAFRRRPSPFSFPPIRHNAAKQNLWSMFDDASWNHIRTTAYDRAGHRCQLCGKQGGGLWTRLATPQERARGRAVECHEIWNWEVVDPASGVGIQRLKRLLILCPDCHLAFHEGRTLQEAKRVGIEREAAEYIKARRMLLNRCDGAAIDAQVARDAESWQDMKSVGTWIVDLSHLAAQDFMADHTMVLRENNKAGVTEAQVGGISFRTEDGVSFAATDAENLARGEPPRPDAGSSMLF